jgi:hypothetical protein
MPGMMRWSCSRGCCVRDDRASEKRDWQLTEWAQSDPQAMWAGATRPPRGDDAAQGNYWASMRELDDCMNRKAS